MCEGVQRPNPQSGLHLCSFLGWRGDQGGQGNTHKGVACLMISHQLLLFGRDDSSTLLSTLRKSGVRLMQ